MQQLLSHGLGLFRREHHPGLVPGLLELREHTGIR
jgi:hypothetical protein